MKTSYLAVDVHKLVGFTEVQLDIMKREVLPQLEKTVNSTLFEQRVLSYKYSYYTRSWYGKKVWHTVNNFKKNMGLSRSAIYNRFKSGKDQFNSTSDGDIDLALTLYFSNANVLGYTYPNTFATWANKKYFNSRIEGGAEGHAKIIGNIIHEYMHNLGFTHDYNWNSTRRHTVPYAYGYIAQEVALKLA